MMNEHGLPALIVASTHSALVCKHVSVTMKAWLQVNARSNVCDLLYVG
jgi:hypothetical protein